MDRIAARREAALIITVMSRYAQMRDLTDPMFNWREITKQMLLLEDHLFHAYKGCPDCIKKHFLTIEALAEEISSLAVVPPTSSNGRVVPDNWVPASPGWLALSGSHPLAAKKTQGDEGPDMLDPETFADAVRNWVGRILDGQSMAEIGAEIRQLRKLMVPSVCDPRDIQAHVAAAHISRRHHALTHRTGVPLPDEEQRRYKQENKSQWGM